jgi:hypothetical protein
MLEGTYKSGRRVNLRQLKYFASVVEAGNMTRAAEQLCVAQTVLGMQIRKMEEDRLPETQYHRVRGFRWPQNRVASTYSAIEAPFGPF